MRAKSIILISAISLISLVSSCTSNRAIIVEMRDKIDKLPTQKDLLLFRDAFTALDSTIRSTQINILQYEINKTTTQYDSIRTDSDIIKRANEVLQRLRKPPPK